MFRLQWYRLKYAVHSCFIFVSCDNSRPAVHRTAPPSEREAINMLITSHIIILLACTRAHTNPKTANFAPTPRVKSGFFYVFVCSISWIYLPRGEFPNKYCKKWMRAKRHTHNWRPPARSSHTCPYLCGTQLNENCTQRAPVLTWPTDASICPQPAAHTRARVSHLTTHTLTAYYSIASTLTGLFGYTSDRYDLSRSIVHEISHLIVWSSNCWFGALTMMVTGASSMAWPRACFGTQSLLHACYAGAPVLCGVTWKALFDNFTCAVRDYACRMDVRVRLARWKTKQLIALSCCCCCVSPLHTHTHVSIHRKHVHTFTHVVCRAK